MPEQLTQKSTSRLRLGILLIIVSWLPIAQLLIYIAHNNNKLMDPDSANIFRLTVWGIQILIGLVGLWMMGPAVMANAKQAGWKATPKRLWQLLWHG
jgi:hypothetical protein